MLLGFNACIGGLCKYESMGDVWIHLEVLGWGVCTEAACISTSKFNRVVCKYIGLRGK